MKNQENRLDQLFAQAKHQQPLVSFNDTKKRLLPAISTGLVAGILVKWGVLSTKLKFIIMLSSISMISVATLLITNAVISPIEEEAPINLHIPTETVNIDVTAADGVTKTVYYDENNAIIGTLIDSSTKKEYAEFTELPLKPINPLAEEKQTPPKAAAKLIVKTPMTEAPTASLPAASSLDTIRYTITNKTTARELDEMQKEAIQAGLKFSYSARIVMRKIRKLKLKVIRKRGDGKASETSLMVNGSKFKYSFGWVNNESGKAVKLIKTKINSMTTNPCTVDSKDLEDK